MTVTPPKRAGRPRKSEAGDTRAKLLDTALDLFVDKGFAATSVRMIARGAGLSDGGLYAHFPNKRALYDELLASAGPGAVDDIATRLLAEHATATSHPRRFLTELVEAMLDFFDTPRARRFSLLLLREEIPGDPRLVTDMITLGTDTLAPLFAAWDADGLLCDDVGRRSRADGYRTLAWEMLAPLAFIRLVYLHGTDDARSGGRRRARAHLEFFLNTVLRDR